MDDAERTRAVLGRSLRLLISASQSGSPQQVVHHTGAPSTADLARYKDANFPVVFHGATHHWAAHAKWSASYLRECMGDDTVTVAVTPDGLADAIRPMNDTLDVFVQPCEFKTSMSDMLNWLVRTRPEKGNGRPADSDASTSAQGGCESGSVAGVNVRYLQLQNGSFNLEFQKLAGDLDPLGLSWANAVFAPSSNHDESDDGIREEIVPPLCNIWVGNHLSRTSLHHDPYENIYCQIRGSKVFTLFPVEEYYLLNERNVRTGTWTVDDTQDNITERLDDVELSVKLDDESRTIPWLDPSKSLDAQARAITVTLAEGDSLYLPALWYHAVSQIPDEEGLVVAVNYWYDIDYSGRKWRDWQFLRKVAMCAQGRTVEAEAELNEEDD